MTDQDNDLPFGLYERLITSGLKAKLLRFDPARSRIVKRSVDAAEAHTTFTRHIEQVVARGLDGVPDKDRAERQTTLTNSPRIMLRTLDF